MNKHEPKLGELAGEHDRRDAIHIAIAPVIAAETLKPGDHVTVVAGKAVKSHDTTIGIVDPFRSVPIHEGERFWLLLYPRSITSLRHEWTHPAFGVEPPPAAPESEQWLRALAERMGSTYEHVLEMGEEAMKTGCGWAGDDSAQDTVNAVKDEFWTHWERVTGRIVSHSTRENAWFSCSC